MSTPAWTRVEREAARLRAGRLSDIVAGREPGAMVLRAAGIEADLGKLRLDAAALSALHDYARERDVAGALAALFAGEAVNPTEGRAALHWLARGERLGLGLGSGAAARAERERDFARRARSGALGFPVRGILHVGIGGSDLGPRLVHDALSPVGDGGPALRFCANIDPDEFARAVASLDPATTLAIVVSKSFRTPETAANARFARAWFDGALGEAASGAHLAAVSSAPQLAMQWGAAADRIFDMSETVGGRYSLWTAVGLSVRIALGEAAWEGLLAGAASIDAHVRTAAPEANLALALALADVWSHAALGVPSRCVLAYAHRLRRLPDFLQQLEMESNGKSAAAGAAGRLDLTAPVTWGSEGTNGQHSFHQLLHQGTRDVVAEFVAVAPGADDLGRGRRELVANAIAQAAALLAGRSEAEAEVELLRSGVAADRARALAPHLAMPGGRASIFVLLDEVSPATLGALLALYEHRTYLAGVLAGVNPFDQWGVERGKVLAEEIVSELAGHAKPTSRDPSTDRLVARLRC